MPTCNRNNSLLGRSKPTVQYFGVHCLHFNQTNIYRTQVYLGSDLWVRVSLTNYNTLLKQVMKVLQVMQVMQAMQAMQVIQIIKVIQVIESIQRI